MAMTLGRYRLSGGNPHSSDKIDSIEDLHFQGLAFRYEDQLWEGCKTQTYE